MIYIVSIWLLLMIQLNHIIQGVQKYMYKYTKKNDLPWGGCVYSPSGGYWLNLNKKRIYTLYICIYIYSWKNNRIEFLESTKFCLPKTDVKLFQAILFVLNWERDKS